MIWRKLYYGTVALKFFPLQQPFGNFFDQKLLQISGVRHPVNKSEVFLQSVISRRFIAPYYFTLCHDSQGGLKKGLTYLALHKLLSIFRPI